MDFRRKECAISVMTMRRVAALQRIKVGISILLLEFTIEESLVETHISPSAR